MMTHFLVTERRRAGSYVRCSHAVCLLVCAAAKMGGWETLVGWWELGAFTGTRGCTPMALAEVRAKGSASLVRLRRARMRWGMICGVCVGGRRSLRGSRVAALSFGERGKFRQSRVLGEHREDSGTEYENTFLDHI